MQEEVKRAKEADWAPGTLDRTRKAIGDIDPITAEVMSKKLGGEVMYERSVNASSSIGRSTKGTGRIMRQTTGGSSGSSGNNAGGTKSQPEQHHGTGSRKRQEELPVVSPKLNAMLNKLMMEDEYGIKPNYGLFV